MILISNIVLEVLEGGTVPSTNIYGTNKKAYINIGSGNVFGLKWNTPSMTGDTINRYTVVIERYDPTLNVYYPVFNKNVGLVNEFYVASPLLPPLPEQYQLSIYIIAYGKQGSIITSSIAAPYVCKGSGTYINVQLEGYAQPIMKRAVAFVNTRQAAADTMGTVVTAQVLTDRDGNTLVSKEGDTLFAALSADPTTVAIIKNTQKEEVVILDSEGNQVQIKTTRLLTSNDWQLITDSFIKTADNAWSATDIKYEVLVDENGEIITDNNDEPIYVL